MATKIELINELENYDVRTLEKLARYAKLLLIPEEDILVNATMIQMVDKAYELADLHYPEWTDRSKSDFGAFLVELFSLFSEKDFWYINNYANEAFLAKMSLYSNAYHRSISLGHVPRSFKSSSALFTLTFEPGDEATLPEGSLIIKAKDTDDLILSNSEEIVLTSGQTTATATFSVGQYENKYTKFNGRSFDLQVENVDIESLSLEVNDILWSPVVSFSDSASDDKVFLPMPGALASADIKFGDNVFGYRPAVGADLKASYRVGGGSMQEYPPTTLYTIREFPSRVLLSATQNTTLSGGQDQETLAEIKANAPLAFKTFGRITNVADAEAVLQTFPEVLKAKAFVWNTLLSFYVIPTDGEIADSTLLEDLETRIKDVTIMGFTPEGSVTNYVDISKLDITVFILTGFNLENKEAEIRSLVEEFTDPLRGASYGEDFIFSALSGHLISNIIGVQNVVVNEVAGQAADQFPSSRVPVLPTEILKALKSGTPEKTVDNFSITVKSGDIDITVKYLS